MSAASPRTGAAIEARQAGSLLLHRIDQIQEADLNLIDFEQLQLEAPHISFDLPAGGRRMFQGAQGYLATIVRGEVIMEGGEYTGATPGALIRGPQGGPMAG